MRKQCLVFDLDDTLYLERDYVKSGFRTVGAWAAEEIGIDCFAKRAWALFEQGERRHVFNLVLQRAGYAASPELVARMLEVYRGHRPNISVLPDALECLSTLQSQCHMALVSDGYLEVQKRKIGSLGAESFFDLVVLTDYWGRDYWKPHPRAFEYVERRCSARSMEFFHIADNPLKDFTAPRLLGWRTVRVRRPGGLHYEVEAPISEQADFEINDLLGLRNILRSVSG